MAARSPGMYLAYIIQALVGFNVILAVLFKPSDVVVGTILFLLGMVIYVVSWKTKIAFPWFVYFLISLALLIHTSGYIQERYLRFQYWDVLAHTVSGTIVALLGFLLILYLDNTRKYALDPPFVGSFIVLFGMGCEFLWEVWEFFVDTFFGGSLAGPMQANNTDTMTDMIFVLVASLIVGAGCYVYLKRYGKEAIFHDMVRDSPYFQP
ncbi:MAG: hypothetical protein ABFC89_06775 [Methanospirillum sp.]